MKVKHGKEMRKLLAAISVSTLLLVLAVVAYFMADVIVTTNRDIENDKQKLIDASVRSLQDMKAALGVAKTAPGVLKLFDPALLSQVMSGDRRALYGYAVELTLGFYPISYVGIIEGGELAEYGARAGVEVDPAEMPVAPPEGEYQTYRNLFGKDGFFVSVFLPVDLGALGISEGKVYVNLIVDRTQELADIEAYFNRQRNEMITRMSVISAVAVILSLLLTTLGLRYFTRKYVVRPIEELNRAAEEIAEGTFKGEVRVDEDSAYAALQGLLRSGQKVLSRMDAEIKD